VVESIFSMEGDRAPLADLAKLAQRHNAELIVDEAHATGVCGPRGAGSVVESGLATRILATVHTCGKALGGAGAFVCGSARLKEFLINRARTLIFSTALPPYFASQVSAGMNLAQQMEAERAHLLQLGVFLRKELRSHGFDTAASDSQIVPVILGSNGVAIRFAEFLRSRGFGVRPIRPPTVPEGTSRLRLSLTAELSEETLSELVAALIHARTEFPVARALSVSR
jgi:8-amino-7-oxononanoate synthase